MGTTRLGLYRSFVRSFVRLFVRSYQCGGIGSKLYAVE